MSTGCCGAGTIAQEASFPVIGVVGTSDMFSEKGKRVKIDRLVDLFSLFLSCQEITNGLYWDSDISIVV